MKPQNLTGLHFLTKLRFDFKIYFILITNLQSIGSVVLATEDRTGTHGFHWNGEIELILWVDWGWLRTGMEDQVGSRRENGVEGGNSGRDIWN